MFKVKNPVVYIVGPTASGKTGVSIELAKRFNGEIISGDSMQIYKGMHIASAAPDEDEKRGIMHHLFEFLDPNENFSVSQYVKLADEMIADIHSRNKLPIVVGGTGLYISALSEHINFGDEDNDGSVRKSLEFMVERDGLDRMYERLKEVDPEAANKISPSDKKRIIRALEIYEISGMTKTERDAASKKEGKIYNNLIIGLAYEDREKLYERINLRVDFMLKNGLLDEAAQSHKNSGGGTSAQAIGHKELFGYFDGEISLEQAVEHLKMQTRRYAKRQLTWFKKVDGLRWVYMDRESAPIETAANIISEFLF